MTPAEALEQTNDVMAELNWLLIHLAKAIFLTGAIFLMIVLMPLSWDVLQFVMEVL